MNWIKNILNRLCTNRKPRFDRDSEISEWFRNEVRSQFNARHSQIQVPMPQSQQWTAIDQKTTSNFLRSEQGRKLVESCRHKLFSEHLDACQHAGNAEYHNASMKGANNVLSFILYLATEDSISSNDSLANESATAQDQHNLEAETRA